MRYIVSMTLILLNVVKSTNALAEDAFQGKQIKPRYDPSASEEVVRMVLSDNEKTPMVNLSTDGPTVLVFPGDSNIVKCVNTSTYVREAKEESENIQSRNGKWFTEVVFYIDTENLTAENIDAALAKRPTVICRYEYGGKTYRRQVKFRLNAEKRHGVVFFEREEDRHFDEFMNSSRLKPRVIVVKADKRDEHEASQQPSSGDPSSPLVITVKTNPGKSLEANPEPRSESKSKSDPMMITVKGKGAIP